MSFISSRQKVLSIFKQLHKTRKTVFRGDTYALGEVREKINEEFRKNKEVTDTKQLEELVHEAEVIEKTLRTALVQAEYNPETGNYRMNITKDTELLENKPFDPNAKLPKRKRRPKCDDKVS